MAGPKWDDTEEVQEQQSVPSFDDTEELAASPELSDADLEHEMKLRRKDAMGRSLAEGLSFGLADEGVGALNALKNLDTFDLEKIKQAYTEARDKSRSDFAAQKEEFPKTAMASELGGGLLTTLIPGTGVAKGAGVLKNAVTAGKLGALIGLGKSEADLTKGEVGQAALDTTIGAGTGFAGGMLFPQLGKLYAPAETAIGRAGQMAGLTTAGAGLGGAYGYNTAAEGEDPIERAKEYALGGATAAGASRLIPAAARTIGNTGFGEKVGRAFNLGKEGMPIFGQEFEEHLAGKTKDFSKDLSTTADEAFGGQAVAARQQVEGTAQNLVSQIDSQKKLIGENINSIFNKAERQGTTAKFNEILDPLETLGQNISEAEKPALRGVERVLKKFEIRDPDGQFEGYRALGANDLRELRKAVYEARNYSKGVSSDLGATLKDVYNGINESVGKIIDDPNDLKTLQLNNQQYSRLSNLQEEFLPEGKFNLMEKEALPGPQVFKYLKGLPNEQKLAGEGLNEQAITGILDDINPDITQGVRQELGEAPLNQTKFQGLQQEFGTEPAAKMKIKSFESPAEYASSKTEQGMEELAKLNPDAAGRIKTKGEDLAKLLDLAGSRFDPERNIGTVSTEGLIGSALRKGVYPAANVAGLGVNKISSLATAPAQAVNSLIGKLESKGYTATASYLKSLAERDPVGRNAVLFTLYQTPDRRKELEEVMGGQSEQR